MSSSAELSLGLMLLSSKGEPQEVIPRLFIGGYKCGMEVDRLKNQLGITHILSVGGPVAAPKYFTTKELLKVDDLPNYNIFQHFDECVQWIDEGRKQGGVLVHCFHGVSRSATIVIAYLMFHKQIPFDEAHTILWKVRPVIKPNPGFVQQLKNYELKLFCKQEENVFSLKKKSKQEDT